MATVRSFKLPSGQEIIGKETAVTSRGVILDDVRELQALQRPDGTFGLGIAPFTFSSRAGKIELYFSSIVGEVLQIPSELEREYLSNVSGIQLAMSL